MMKKIFLFTVMTALLAGAVVSCSDYPEDWGFEVQLSGFDYTLNSATANGYDADLHATVAVLNEGAGINEYGFELSGGEYLPATVQRNGDNVTLTATARGLQFGTYYNVSVVVKGNEASAKFGQNFRLTKTDLSPKEMYLEKPTFDFDGGFVKLNGKCVYNTKPSIESQVTFNFLNQTQTAFKSAEGYEGSNYYVYYNAQFSLNDLAVGSYSDSYMFYKSVVDSQTVTRSTAKVTVTACTSNPNDGDKGDYYQLNGVKWAKYNMYLDQLAVTIGSGTISYFPFGDPSSLSHWTSSVNPFAEYTVSGEYNVQGTERDIVYSNLSGWKLPSRSDFARLYGSNVSSIAQVGSDGYVTDIYFAPAKNNRRLVISGDLNVNWNSMLCFGDHGVRRYYRGIYTGYGYTWNYETLYKNNITYMTSEFRNVYGGNSIIYAAQLYGNNASFLELSFLHNLHVRPIKAY